MGECRLLVTDAGGIHFCPSASTPRLPAERQLLPGSSGSSSLPLLQAFYQDIKLQKKHA
jgi:hypothetical protein